LTVMGQSPVIVERFYGFLVWIFERTSQYPKTYRYSLGGKIQQEALAILEHLVQAAYRKQKRPILEDINRKLESMRFLIRLSKDLKCLSLRQYEYAGNECMEVGNQVGGWIKSVRRG